MASSRTQIEGRIVPILPLGTRVLIRPKTVPDYVKMAGGKVTLIMPDSCKPAAPTTGIIKALGDELMDMPSCRLKVGQEVLFSIYAGVEVRFREGDEQGNAYILLQSDDVLGVLQENMELIPEEVPQGSWKAPVGQ
jgi:co-chaperonin GroES (HSP10)